jgi:hypothetical protein
VDGVKTVGDQSFPPFGKLPGRQGVEIFSRCGDRGVSVGELPYGVAEILLLRGQSQGHDRGRAMANMGFGRTG